MDIERDLKSLIVKIIRDEVRWMRHYLAQVVDNNDTLNKGRVKVIIPELGFDTPEQGMWCFPRQGDSLSVPIQDEYVEIYFIAGDPNRPVYIHYATESKTEFKNYSSPKDRIIFESPKTGEFIKYNDEEKKITMQVTESEITIDADSNVTVGGNINIAGATNISLLAQNETLKIEMNGTGMKLTTGDASAWKPNIIAVCPFTGASHGGSVAGIVKLTGG